MKLWKRIVQPAAVVAHMLETFAQVTERVAGPSNTNGKLIAVALRAASERVKLCDDEDATAAMIAVVLLLRFPVAILVLGDVAEHMHKQLDEMDAAAAAAYAARQKGAQN